MCDLIFRRKLLFATDEADMSQKNSTSISELAIKINH